MCNILRKMGESRESYCSEEEYCVYVKKSLSGVKINTCNVANALKEKYKKILGTKEPIVVLERCSLVKNIFGNHSSQRISKNTIKVNSNKRNYKKKNNKKSKKKNNKTAKKATNKTKNLYKNDLLSYNTKIVVPELSKKDNTIVTPNCSDRLKDGIHNCISTGEKSSEFNIWKKKCSKYCL